MKKRHSIRILLAAAALLLATAACTKDELADGDRLPEGQYPLEIARITLSVEGGEAQPWGAPATRVSEDGDGKSSTFDADDKFAVQIDGEGEVGTYTVQDDGSAEAEIPLYWSDRDEDHTVTAWYPATDGTLDLGDQSQSLAYLLGATGTGDYQTPVTLSFTHALAKVRVTPTDDALGEVQSLQLYAYTQCTYEKGTVVQGSQESWIEMKKCEYTENGNAITCWEANVVPGYTITKLQANGTEERNLSAAITPEAGKFYNITLNKDKGYTDDGQGNYTVTSTEGLKNIAKLVNEEWKLGINITLTACYATGSVTGSGSGTIYVGGVTGSNNFGILTACYHAKEDVSGPTGTTGGVAGRNFKGSMSGGGIITACYWGDNGQTQGIGEDQVGTGGTTQVTDGNWSGAKDAMNTALSGTSWRYVLGTDGLPVLEKNQ